MGQRTEYNRLYQRSRRARLKGKDPNAPVLPKKGDEVVVVVTEGKPYFFKGYVEHARRDGSSYYIIPNSSKREPGEYLSKNVFFTSDMENAAILYDKALQKHKSKLEKELNSLVELGG